MNKQLFALLKTKFDGVQDAILKRVAEKYGQNISETADEDELQGIVDDVTFQNVLESYGDSRATEASRTAVENFRKKQGNNQNSKAGQSQDQPVDQLPDDTPKWARSLIQTNQELQKKVEGLEKKERTKSLTETVHTKLTKGKKVPMSFFKNRPISVEDESEVDSVVDQIAEDYNAFRKEMVEKGLISDSEPKQSLGTGGSDKEVEKDIEEWASENEKE